MRVCRNPACRKPITRRPDRGYRQANGWCYGCNGRWIRAGRPDTGPPPPLPHDRQMAAMREVWQERVAGRAEDYQWLTRELRMSRAEAAARLGVSERTAWRYEARLTGPRTASERAA
jgi:hypothetical protein